MSSTDAFFLLLGVVSFVASVGWVAWMAYDGLVWLWRKHHGLRRPS